MIGSKVTDSFAVSPQITADDVPAIAAAGYKSILCNRPDSETPGQPAFATIEAAAKTAGLEIRFQPVSGQPQAPDVDAFAALTADLPAPVFAYCRSGRRCIVLWALAESRTRPLPEVLNLARDAGYDLGGA